MIWDLGEIKKVDFTRLEQEVFNLTLKHAADNEELRKDLINLIEMIKEEKKHNDDIKSLAFDLANKI
jgi:hypothetical protein